MYGRLAFTFLLVVSAAAAQAQVIRPLTDQYFGRFRVGDLDGAGQKAWLTTNIDPAGGEQLLARQQIVEYDLLLSSATVLTDFDADVGGVLGSDDGNWFAFTSRGDLTGQNADRSWQVFTVHRSGSDLTQVTAGTGDSGVESYDFAGSGNRIAFTSRADVFGTNPLGFEQLYVVDRDGSNLAQITQRATPIGGPDQMGGVTVSDDGQRIAFESDWNLGGLNPLGVEIFAIEADGTGLRQLTSETAATARRPRISGDGSTIVFATNKDDVFLGPYRIYTIDWGGTTESAVTPVSASRTAEGNLQITDDGQWVFYDFGFTSGFDNEIYKIKTDGTNETQLTFGTDGGTGMGALADDGSKVLLRSAGPITGLTFDGGAAVTFDGSGAGAEKLTESFGTTYVGGASDITADGSKVVVTRSPGIFLLEPGEPRGNPEPLLDTVPSSNTPQITDDGQTIVFASWSDPLGTNPSGTEIFAIESDGTGLRQLTDTGSSRRAATPAMVGDGSWIVFQAAEDFTGGNPDNSFELFRIRPDGTGIAQITDDDDGLFKIPRIDEAGNWVVYQSQGDPVGKNGDGSIEVFRIRADGTGVEQISDSTMSTGGWFPDISGNGDKIVFSGNGDPFGTNADGNREIFLWEPGPPATLTQLTDTVDGDNVQPRISTDGAYVWFYGDATVFDPVPVDHDEPYRIRLSDGLIERVGGLLDLDRRGVMGAGFEPAEAVSPTADGRRAVFHAEGARSSANLDGSGEMWFVDFDASTGIFVTKETVVSWTAAPGPVRYDVIRGNAADLQVLPDETVDLGAAVCVEDDSPDDVSDVDAVAPASGEVFFYLYRGTQGGSDGPGSYGASSAGQERVTGAGCPD